MQCFDSNIEKVNVIITYPDNSQINETMFCIDNTYYYNSSYNIKGTYNFYIWARDKAGNENISSEHSFQIFTEEIQFTFELFEGWNLITIPCYNNWTAKTLGQNISYCKIISRWNSSIQQYESYLVGISPPEYDFDIEDGKGYFIYVENDTVFSMVGLPIENVSFPLHIGWNLIGWFRNETTNASSLAENIKNCTIVSKWNATLQQFQSYLVGISPPEFDFEIKQGMGMFIYTNTESIWNGYYSYNAGSSYGPRYPDNTMPPTPS